MYMKFRRVSITRRTDIGKGWMIMDNFTFYSPTCFVFGKDTENQAGALVRRFGGSRMLIHYGGGSAVRSGLIGRVEAVTPEIEALAGGSASKVGTGGMITKIEAAKIAVNAGTDMVIANGHDPSILYDIIEGKDVGTRFLGHR